MLFQASAAALRLGRRSLLSSSPWTLRPANSLQQRFTRSYSASAIRKESDKDSDGPHPSCTEKHFKDVTTKGLVEIVKDVNENPSNLKAALYEIADRLESEAPDGGCGRARGHFSDFADCEGDYAVIDLMKRFREDAELQENAVGALNSYLEHVAQQDEGEEYERVALMFMHAVGDRALDEVIAKHDDPTVQMQAKLAWQFLKCYGDWWQ